MACTNCFLTSDAIRTFSAKKLTNFRWCSDLLLVQCEEILKGAFSLNLKILYMFSAPITELGTYLSSIEENGSEFLSKLLDRTYGKPSNNLSVTQLVSMLTSELSTHEPAPNFDLETVFQIMKESMMPQHILHFDSTEIRIVKNYEFIRYLLPSEELVGYPLVKLSNSSGSFKYYVNREPSIPLCRYQQIWGNENSSLFDDAFCNQVYQFHQPFGARRDAKNRISA